MTCDTARTLLLFYRPGKTTDLAAEDVAALEAHLSTCPACAALVGRQTEADAAIGRAFRQVPVPGGLRDRLQARAATDVLRASAAAGRTIIVSMHQLDQATRICDRLVLLDNGRVAGIGSMAELRSAASLPDGSLEEVFLALTA